MSIEHRIREVVDRHVARVRQEQDALADALTQELVRLIAERGQVQKAEAPATPVSDGPDRTAREIHLATLERLLAAFRRLDESTSLNGILEVLAQAAEAETSRVAILLVDGYMFRLWGHFGFEEGKGPLEMPIGASGTLAAAVALRQTSFVPPVIEGRDPEGPAFMRVPAGHTGLVVPLVVGGEAVAVLYADDRARELQHEDAPLWTEEVELLARHAALRLENVTSVRTVEVLAQPE